MNRLLFIPIFTLFSLSVSLTFSQDETRTYISHSLTPAGLEIQVSDGKYIINYYSEKIVETTFIPNGEIYQKESHSVSCNKFNTKKIIVKNLSTLLEATLENYEKKNAIIIDVAKKPFSISYRNKSGWIASSDVITQENKIRFYISNTEVLYGGGARALGMNRRGNRLQLYNRAHYGYEERSELMNFTMPVVLSSKKYMIHFDNASTGYLDLDSKKDNTILFEPSSGNLTYQVVVGDTWEDLITNYTYLTGRQPLPPRWALGNFSSRFGYHSQAEVLNTIAAFKRDSIPVDAIILDLYWFGKEIQGTMGNLDFYKDSFPDPNKMIADLKSKGVKTILITEPFILTTSKRWNEAVENGILAKGKDGKPFTYDFYFGNTGLIDIYNPTGNRWFWNIYKDLKNRGVAGFWGDLGEPEVHPEALIHSCGTANEVHNIYGHDWARLIHDGFRRDFPKERPFILMRAGYSGSQRFGMIPWSGDVNRTWGGLRPQSEISLQMGMQGMAYMHSDLGGFAGANDDPELYVRWLQYGVFNPVFRPHAQEEVASEPVFKDANTKSLAKKAIELRYQLMPYNYTLAYENSKKGLPFMRPIFYYDTCQKALTMEDEYFWGDRFLIAPVFEKGQQKRSVYFPMNAANWFDFYTDKVYKGGNTFDIALNDSNIPTFVKGGSFVPLLASIQSTDQYDLNLLKMHYYVDASVPTSTYTLYDDNGLTTESNTDSFYHFSAEQEKKALEIKLETEDAKPIDFELIVHKVNKKPKHILVNKKQKIKFSYTENQQTIHLKINSKQFDKNTLKVNIVF